MKIIEKIQTATDLSSEEIMQRCLKFALAEFESGKADISVFGLEVKDDDDPTSPNQS